jgi:hypothetical protein
MPCLLAFVALVAPRIMLVLLWLFGGTYLGRAYQTVLWPLLGFLFMPFTTLAYAFAMNSNRGTVNGIYLALVVVAALMDLGSLGGGDAARRHRRTRRR